MKVPDAGKIGWGFTSLCNANCVFCYSKKHRELATSWNYDDAVRVINQFADVWDDIDLNWGTGENVLLKDFRRVVSYASKKGYTQGYTTNGTLANYPDVIENLDEIDVSIDFYDPKLHNQFRRVALFNLALKTLKTGTHLGKTMTVVTVALRQNMNYDNGYRLYELASQYDAHLRLNLFFTPDPMSEFVPSPEQVAEFLQGVADAGGRLVVTSDPAVAQILGVEPLSYLGSMRILTDGWVSPSTYLTSERWKGVDMRKWNGDIEKIYNSKPFVEFEEGFKKYWPREAVDRVLEVGYDYYVKEEMPHIKMKRVKSNISVHVGYLPTTIMR